MAKRNLTIQLDDDVIHRAKVLAATRRMSVSALVAQELERLVADAERYEDAWRAALQSMQEVNAIDEGTSRGVRTWRRDDLYDRFERYPRPRQ